MHYKAKEVKGMKVAEVREVLAQYIIDVQPNAYGEVITEKLLTAIRTRSSDISVTMNVYTNIGLDDAEKELRRMEEFQKAQAEVEKKNDAKMVSQKMFKVI